jgi:antitoxin (DNA-binding transcriptional repressor) of toxin-antitoxin stability system
MEKQTIGRTIEAAEVPAKCYFLLDEISRTGKGVLITKNGRPFVELLPHRDGATEGRKPRRRPTRRSAGSGKTEKRK